MTAHNPASMAFAYRACRLAVGHSAIALADFALEVHPGTPAVLDLKSPALEGSGDLAGASSTATACAALKADKTGRPRRRSIDARTGRSDWAGRHSEKRAIGGYTSSRRALVSFMGHINARPTRPYTMM